MLNLTAHELLTTTRAVRKRLDFERPVELSVVEACIEIALQAPSGGNTQGWHFYVVTDADKRLGLADLYRRAWAGYRKAPGSIYDLYQKAPDGPQKLQFGRVIESADHLVDNLHRVPVLVIPCIGGRVDRMAGPHAGPALAAVYGSILPATWSYMLAARLHGLGTVWTTAHLGFEKDAAELLGIPYEQMTQVALIPTAYSIGTEFKASLRKPLDGIMHVDQW